MWQVLAKVMERIWYPIDGTELNVLIIDAVFARMIEGDGTCLTAVHFPAQRGLAGTRMSPFWIVLELRMMELVMATGAMRRAKLQLKCHHQQNKKHPAIYGPDAIPVTQSTVSEHRREKVSHSTELLTPNSPGVFRPCLWPLKTPSYYGDGC